MSDQTRGRDARLIQFATETPWAILPSALLTIRAIIARHRAGDRLTPEEIEAAIGQPRPRTPSPPGGAVAVIPIRGVIAPHADLMTEISGGTSLDTFRADLAAAVGDQSVGTIVLDIDSPGGSVFGLREAAQDVRAAREHKRVVAVANYLAASAAYYLMAQATEKVAAPSAMVGSVGTIAQHEDISRALEAEGIDITTIFAGDHKADEIDTEPLSDEARAEVQRRVDHYYGEFVEDVALGCGIPAATVETKFGQGRLLTVPDAFRVGMIDRVATIEQVIADELAPGQRQPGTRADATRDLAVVKSAALQQAQKRIDDIVTAGAVVGASATFDGGAQVAAEIREAASPVRVAEGESVAATPGGATGQPTTPKEGRTMRNREELVARVQEIETRLTQMHTEAGSRRYTDEEEHERTALGEERADIEATLKNLDSREREIARFAVNPDNVVGGDGAATPANDWNGATNADTRRNLPANLFDVAAYRAQSRDGFAELWKDGAKRVNEGARYETDKPEASRALVEKLLDNDTKDAAFAIRMLETANPAYDRAFGKLVMGKQLTSQERSLVDAAVSHTGLGSETPVPITIDPTVILTSDGAANPIRAISRNVTITGPTWQGLTSDGVEVTYEAELSEVGDQTPDYDAPKATVAKAHGYVEFSIEVDQDWPSLRDNLRVAFQDAKDEKEADKFLFGSGSDEPQGIIDALTGTSSDIDTGTTGTLDLSDLDLMDLPPRFDTNAQWVGNRGTFAALRALAGERTDFWVPIMQGFPNRPMGTTGYQLLGYPVNIASGMSKLVTTNDEAVLILGDFSKGFVVVDRVGMNVELIPHVLGSNRRPIGARALYAYFRNTSQLITEKAFLLLRIKGA